VPFTLAHPAAVIPLARTKLLVSALVAGSLTPDFLYFVPGAFDHNFSHTLPGLALFCIPVGLIWLLLFHRVMKVPLLSLVPNNPRNMLAPHISEFAFGPWRRFLLVLLSLTVGSLTHLAWDSFTHERGLVVANVALLKVVVIQTSLGAIRVFKLLQHASTVAGCAALWLWYLRWAKGAKRIDDVCDEAFARRDACDPRKVTWILATSAFVTGLTGAYIASRSLNGLPWAQSFANRSILITMGVLFVELLLFSAYWHLSLNNTRAINSAKHGEF